MQRVASLTPLSFRFCPIWLCLLHRELDLVDCVRIVLIAQSFGQPQVQLPPGTNDLIAVLVDPLGDGIVRLTNCGKWPGMNNTSHLLNRWQIMDLDTSIGSGLIADR